MINSINPNLPDKIIIWEMEDLITELIFMCVTDHSINNDFNRIDAYISSNVQSVPHLFLTILNKMT
jgi:hypothetical protein